MKKESQFRKITDEFESLKPFIDSGDRRKVADECDVHPETVNRYIRGEIRKYSLAVKILKTLREIVEKRREIV